MKSHRPMPVIAITTFEPTELVANFARLPNSGSTVLSRRSSVASAIVRSPGVVALRQAL
jgi:hypothetical protein